MHSGAWCKAILLKMKCQNCCLSMVAVVTIVNFLILMHYIANIEPLDGNTAMKPIFLSSATLDWQKPPNTQTTPESMASSANTRSTDFELFSLQLEVRSVSTGNYAASDTNTDINADANADARYFSEDPCFVQNGCHLYLSSVPYFMQKSVLMIALAKDIESTVGHALIQFDEIFCVFKKSLFFVFESNSVDRTAVIIDKWLNQTNYTDFCESMKYKPKPHRHKSKAKRKRKRNLFTYPQSLFSLPEDVNADETQKQNHKEQLHSEMQDFSPHSILKQRLNLTKYRNDSSALNRMQKMVYFRHLMLCFLRDPQTKRAYDIPIIFDHKINNGNDNDNDNDNIIDNSNSDVSLQENDSIWNLTNDEYSQLFADMDIAGNNSHHNKYYNQNVSIHAKTMKKRHEFLLCTNGYLVPGLMRDTFATVFANDTWMWPYVWQLKKQVEHYWQFNKEDWLFNFPHKRFQKMQSCFGGIGIYSNPRQMLYLEHDENENDRRERSSELCDYLPINITQITLNIEEQNKRRRRRREQFHSHRNRSNHSNNKSNIVGIDIDIDITDVIENSDDTMIKSFHDWLQIALANKYCTNICTEVCEHIPFHYCLRAKSNYVNFLAKNARLWYYSLDDMLFWSTQTSFQNERRAGYRLTKLIANEVNTLAKQGLFNQKIQKFIHTTQWHTAPW